MPHVRVPGVGQGVLLEVSGALKGHFWAKFRKQKLPSTKGKVGKTGSGTSLRCPPASPWTRGGSAAVVPWPIGPKLGTSVVCRKLIPSWYFGPCHLTFTHPSMTEKVRGGPEGVALPSIIPRDTVISTCHSITTLKKVNSKESQSNAG